MEQIKKIYVSIQFDAEEIEVGELVTENKLIYFKYYPTAKIFHFSWMPQVCGV